MLKFISKPETPKGLLRAYLKSYHIFFLSQWKKGLKTQIEPLVRKIEPTVQKAD
jgi:hypothetical protein